MAFGFFGAPFGEGGAFKLGVKVAGGGVGKMEVGSFVAGLISGDVSAVVTVGAECSTGGVAAGVTELESVPLTRGVTFGGR